MFRRLTFAGLFCALLFALIPSQPVAAFRLWKPKKKHVARSPVPVLLPASGTPPMESGTHRTHIHLVKRDAAGRLLEPPLDRDGNVMCNAGITRMLNLLIGAGGTAFNNSNSRIGVGNGTTTPGATDTDLSAASGSSNRYFTVCDATFPNVSGQAVTFQATFTGTNGGFTWSEFGVDNGSSSGTTVTAPLLDHGLASLGTKDSTVSTSWQLQVAITESADWLVSRVWRVRTWWMDTRLRVPEQGSFALRC